MTVDEKNFVFVTLVKTLIYCFVGVLIGIGVCAFANYYDKQQPVSAVYLENIAWKLEKYPEDLGAVVPGMLADGVITKAERDEVDKILESVQLVKSRRELTKAVLTVKEK